MRNVQTVEVDVGSCVLGTAVCRALLAEKPCRRAVGLHVVVALTLPAVECAAPDWLEGSAAVSLDVGSHRLHVLGVILLTRVGAQSELEGSDDGTTDVVGCCVGVRMLEPKPFHEVLEADLLTWLEPEVDVLCQDLGVDTTNYRAQTVDVEPYVFVLQVVLIVGDILPEGDDRMVASLERSDIGDRLDEDTVEYLASVLEIDEATGSEAVSLDSPRVGVRPREMGVLDDPEEKELDALHRVLSVVTGIAALE